MYFVTPDRMAQAAKSKNAIRRCYKQINCLNNRFSIYEKMFQTKVVENKNTNKKVFLCFFRKIKALADNSPGAAQQYTLHGHSYKKLQLNDPVFLKKYINT